MENPQKALSPYIYINYETNAFLQTVEIFQRRRKNDEWNIARLGAGSYQEEGAYLRRSQG